MRRASRRLLPVPLLMATVLAFGCTQPTHIPRVPLLFTANLNITVFPASDDEFQPSIQKRVHAYSALAHKDAPLRDASLWLSSFKELLAMLQKPSRDAHSVLASAAMDVTILRALLHFDSLPLSVLGCHDIDTGYLMLGENRCKVVDDETYLPYSAMLWIGQKGSMFLGEESYTYTNGSTVTCEKWSLPFEERVACVMLDGTVVYHDQLSFSVVDDDSDDVSDGRQKLYHYNGRIHIEYTDFAPVSSFPSNMFSIPSQCASAEGNYDWPSNPPYGLFDGFENGEVANFWVPCGRVYHMWECGHIYAQTEVVRSGKYSANITVQPGDISEGVSNQGMANMLAQGGKGGDNDSERDELNSRQWATIGEDMWYGFSFFLPSDFPITPDRLVMGQWKQGGMHDNSPLMAQRFVNNNWYYTIQLFNRVTKFNLPTLQLGVWHDMIYNIKFISTSDGYFRAWHNGTQIIDYLGTTSAWQGIPVIYNKFGLYRDDWNTSWTCFFDNYSIGTSYEAVNPARFDH